MNQYGFFIDLSRCIGCNACTVSCKQWHDISPGPAKPMRVYQWETGNFPDVRLHMLPVMCFHCESPSCVEACENGALYKEEKYGAVLADADKCRGTRKCWDACPYGSPQYLSDEPEARMLKCNMCIDRLEEGLKPICVLSCGMRAMEFGPLTEIVRKYGNLTRLNAKPGYAPCRLACPAEVDAEGYIGLIVEDKVKEAIELFRENNPFAGVLGRVCTHPCEADCQRGKVDWPVSIRSLKRYMADYELGGKRAKVNPVARTKDEKVAIVGSGPAGLSCAYDLVKLGYPVTVFEAAAQSGGMMRYGIPEYRLPNEILDNEIEYIKEMGVEIKTHSPVGRLEELRQDGYQAIFLATGAWASHKLGVAGEDSEGIIYALDFLRRYNSGEQVEVGNNVVVIGGGSVAIDAARVALRLKAEEVHLICLESRDLACADRMLAEDMEVEQAEIEGVIIHPCLGISKVIAHQNSVAGLETVGCLSVLDEEGRFAPEFTDDAPGVMKADTIIVAIGQRPDTAGFSKLKKALSGGIVADELTVETSQKGIFAGGDVVTGPSNIISAIAQGKQAAISIDRYLRGLDLRKDRELPVRSSVSGVGPGNAPPPAVPKAQRLYSTEAEQGIGQEVAQEQASRCFKCGTTMPCIIFKPVDAKEAVLAWDAMKALELWQSRQPYNGEPLPEIFAEIADVTEASLEIVGRNKLVLKAKSGDELLYYTTDNE
ncbi:MAG: FAD-dependent oxidoreductase [Chloroflexi bacterium]|nr:FAD-dependent oxidoreductase [Chloroflexota bacterium]